jgi:hypothetical protein
MANLHRYDPHRHNPISRQRFPGGLVKLDPHLFEKQIAGTIATELDKVRRKVITWLRKYGLNNVGATFISEDDLFDKLERQFGKNMEQKVAEKFRDCDGAILISDKRPTDLGRILLLGDWDTSGLEKISLTYWNEFDFPETDKEFNARMRAVMKLLRHEFDEIMHQAGFYVSREASPFVFKPKDKQYKEINYRIIPVHSYIRKAGI